jgi:glyceraldehyde 3-phosphate dehydrogenase
MNLSKIKEEKMKKVVAVRVAINGFGRIGRRVLSLAQEKPGIEVVAINDLFDVEQLAYLLKYDSVHGRFPGKVEVKDGKLVVNGKEIEVTAIKNPKELPWSEMDVDVAIESTGVFRKASGDRGGYLDHITAGARKVILTVPAKDDIRMIVLGVNSDEISSEVKAYSNASCTTNCLAPVAKVLHENFGGIVSGLMTTTHAYTGDQRLLDSPHDDPRRARAAALSIIPTTTGAAKAVGKVIPELEGKLDGMAMRVPVPNGSVVDLVCELGRDTTIEEINAAMKEAAAKGDLKDVLAYTEDPIVSVDIVGNLASSIFDAKATMVVGKRMVKVIAWYDNETGYSARVLDLAKLIG